MIRESILDRLAVLHIQLVTETPAHALFTRENFIVVVERRGDEFGSIGGTGTLTEQGLAYLIWRDGQAFLKSKSAEIPADEAQVAAIRRFSQDIENALR